MTAAGPDPARSAAEAAEPQQRRVVYVVGSARSGTATVAGALRALGLHVPQPEVPADQHNPRGYVESRWVADFHAELLRRANVSATDARPGAWFATAKLATHGPLRVEAQEWLATHVDGHAELVVKDPRLVWFVGLWRAAALRNDAEASYLTMLRPPTEVVASGHRLDGGRVGAVQRTAAWLNTMLHTERGTREEHRAFLRYGDLLTDWTIPLYAVAERFGLESVRRASANDVRAVHAWIDPGLWQARQVTWEELQVPKRLRELAQEAWVQLDRLADDDGDDPAVRATLDQLRAAYVELYEESEAIAHSTADASYREGRADGLREAGRGRAGTPVAAARARVRRALGREG